MYLLCSLLILLHYQKYSVLLSAVVPTLNLPFAYLAGIAEAKTCSATEKLVLGSPVPESFL